MACNIEGDVKGAGAEDGTLIPTFLSHDNLKSQSSLRQVLGTITSPQRMEVPNV